MGTTGHPVGRLEVGRTLVSFLPALVEVPRETWTKEPAAGIEEGWGYVLAGVLSSSYFSYWFTEQRAGFVQPPSPMFPPFLKKLLFSFETSQQKLKPVCV